MRGDKYSQLVSAVNAGLSACGTSATLVYARNNARVAPTGDIITLPARLDGPPIPAEYILEAMTSLLAVRSAWLRIQNTGQAVIVAGCSAQNFHPGDVTWEPPTSTVTLATAKSLWVSASAVREMKIMQRIRTAPLAAMMFMCFYRGGKNEVTVRFAFYKSDSEPNVLKISKCVYEAIDAAEARSFAKQQQQHRAFEAPEPVVGSASAKAQGGACLGGGGGRSRSRTPPGTVPAAVLQVPHAGTASTSSRALGAIGGAVKYVKNNIVWIVLGGLWSCALAVITAYIR